MPSIVGAIHLIPHLIDKNENKRKKRSIKLETKEERKKYDPYKRRNQLLKELGYSSYAEYLTSDEWKKIRHQVLEKYPLCILCNEKATEVHHSKYHAYVMIGLNNGRLAPLCSYHHNQLEMDDNGKRRMGKANCDLIEKARETPHGKEWLKEFYKSANICDNKTKQKRKEKRLRNKLKRKQK